MTVYNYAGSKQKSHKVMTVRMSETQDKASPSQKE